MFFANAHVFARASFAGVSFIYRVKDSSTVTVWANPRFPKTDICHFA